MTKAFYSIVGILLIPLSIFTISSCTEDDDDAVISLTANRVGTYGAEADCELYNGGETSYSGHFDIAEDPNVENGLALTLVETGVVLYVTMTSSTSFNLPLQEVGVSGVIAEYEGSGVFNGDDFELTYTSTVSGTVSTCVVSTTFIGSYTCADGEQNGNETGVDCGGPDCAECITCTDGIQNGDELGIDCGGSDCAPCAPCPATVTDANGNVYNVVDIGGQCWMQENLKVELIDNGEPVGYYYDDAPANADIYGKLYHYAFSSGLCPDGWHIPTVDQWKILRDYLGGPAVAGGKMKSTSSLWDEPNAATNSSGFSALPAGWKNSGGGFNGYYGIGTSTKFLTSDAVSPRIFFDLDFNSEGLSNSAQYAISGASCRCIRD